MVSIAIAPHALFRREGRNLYLDLPLTVDEAVLGASVRVPTLTGAVELTIPAGANDGRVLRLRGKGLTAGKEHGDLLVTLRIRLPETDSRLRAFAESLRETGSYKPRGAEFG
jgi:DnaJ-class molecular chaperone